MRPDRFFGNLSGLVDFGSRTSPVRYVTIIV
jgi:hypothetical protein